MKRAAMILMIAAIAAFGIAPVAISDENPAMSEQNATTPENKNTGLNSSEHERILEYLRGILRDEERDRLGREGGLDPETCGNMGRGRACKIYL